MKRPRGGSMQACKHARLLQGRPHTRRAPREDLDLARRVNKDVLQRGKYAFSGNDQKRMHVNRRRVDQEDAWQDCSIRNGKGHLQLVGLALDELHDLVELGRKEVQRCHDAPVRSELVLLHDLLVVHGVADVDVAPCDTTTSAAAVSTQPAPSAAGKMTPVPSPDSACDPVLREVFQYMHLLCEIVQCIYLPCGQESTVRHRRDRRVEVDNVRRDLVLLDVQRDALHERGLP